MYFKERISMVKRNTNFVLMLLLAAVGCLAQAGDSMKENSGGARGHVMLQPEHLKWGPINPASIQGTPPADFPPLKSQVAVVSGEPSKAGLPFVIRIKTPDGERIPPHWHPQDENITVLQGTFFLATGEKFDQVSGHELKVGSYALMPKNTWHFAWTKGETIVQVHGVGPFVVNFVKIPEAAKKTSGQ
jgi:quercetin dioxygenase-like cupin family protein